MLIPGRPVTDVVVLEPWPREGIDFNIFTLSAVPIHSLGILYADVYSTPASHLVSTFPYSEFEAGCLWVEIERTSAAHCHGCTHEEVNYHRPRWTLRILLETCSPP